MKIKQKARTKNTTNEYSYFLESNMVQVNLNQGDNAKRPIARRYYLSKDIIKNYKVITNGKNLHQLIDPDIKLMKKEKRKLTTEKDGDYIAGWLLNYEYIKDHYILIAVDPSRQK